MTFRSRKLLNLAHDLPCMARFPHACSQYSGVEPAHSDSQMFGRGHGHKASDWAFAAMCHTAHMMLDTFSREQKQTEWTLAFADTHEWLWSNELVKVA